MSLADPHPSDGGRQHAVLSEALLRVLVYHTSCTVQHLRGCARQQSCCLLTALQPRFSKSLQKCYTNIDYCGSALGEFLSSPIDPFVCTMFSLGTKEEDLFHLEDYKEQALFRALESVDR